MVLGATFDALALALAHALALALLGLPLLFFATGSLSIFVDF